ncbi:hypothetical protein [Nonomuraea cavernae]|uniref:Uncharacterized protein n=1 Tax=Nonomuraea cavernae TaxID=2045107 RepID=A0A918DII1_9ACTN|nr:hypothetical protein [Nonomuraea cavernae]MCA2187242.1 hypothetical protein [Nonomuraea cavernae]GGO68013.1 hypothetical protein GCM10012289_25790 [Nonomuraea cavernae]
MGLTLSPELDAILDLAGLPFPNLDEDEVHLDADAVRVVQAGTSLVATEADTTLNSTATTYTGDSATHLAGYWGEVGNGTGHLAQASIAARIAPVALDGFAYVVTGTKVAVGTIAAVGAVRLATALLTGGPFAGVSATASLLATRQAGVRVLREAGEGTSRVLAPGITRRITEPMQRILQNLRGPGGPGGGFGAPALAGVPTRLVGPSSRRSFDNMPGIMQAKGGRGGGRKPSTEGSANLNAAEQAAKDAKAAGQPFDRKAAKAADAKERRAGKFEGDVNVQKRGRKN